MSNPRTNRLGARISGSRALGGATATIRRRHDDGRQERPGSARAARAAAEIADGMLLAAGAETAWHSREVERIALGIADRLGLDGEERRDVGVTARLHDIGKIALPPALLEKPSQPTATEWKLIHNHTVVGERILLSVEELREIAPWVRHSHERWDGSGYPDGLAGSQIPLASRIVFCADAFHAICSDRPYSSGSSMAAALAEMRRCAGTQFEPNVVAALIEVVREEMYGPLRIRRRSHARLSMFLVVALTLGGSIAGGIAAGRDAASPETIQSSTPLVSATPALETATPRLAPVLVPQGGVAGAVASSKAAPAAQDTDRPETAGRAEALEGQLPAPGRQPGAIGSVTGTASEIGNRLQPSPAESKGERRPADAGGSRESSEVTPAPVDDVQQLPGVDASESLPYSLGVDSAAPPRPRPPRLAPAVPPRRRSAASSASLDERPTVPGPERPRVRRNTDGGRVDAL